MFGLISDLIKGCSPDRSSLPKSSTQKSSTLCHRSWTSLLVCFGLLWIPLGCEEVPSEPTQSEEEMSVGGVQAGGVQAGGVQAGGVQAGGVQAGGVQAGGVQAGGVQAGGVQAGGVQGGASTQTLPSSPLPPPEGAIYVEPEVQREGDPALGYDRFLNAPFVSCGIPLSVFERVNVEMFFPLVGLPREQAYLEGRTGENTDLPYFLTHNTNSEGVDLAGINCMSCHASVFQGELVVGLGNTTLSTTSDVGVFANGIGLLVDDPIERRAWEYWAERMRAAGPVTVLDTTGVVAADNLAVVLFGRRDPVTLEWRDEYQIDLPPEGVPIVPLAVAPLWRMSKKNAMFYTGSFRGDHSRYMFSASSLCLEGVDEFYEIDGYFNHVRAWIASLEPPRWPFELDQERVTRGKEVFEAFCSGCHGTYGESREEEVYPNLIIPIEEVGTDPLLLQFEHLFVEMFSPWFSETLMVESNYLAMTQGYMPPPLDGIWITAPFLHNDSVPTLEALLNSSLRPRYWRRTSTDSSDFDTKRVGWFIVEEERGRAQGAPSNVYDTTRLGYYNTGHTYGDGLLESQRLDLIEYLKTL